MVGSGGVSGSIHALQAPPAVHLTLASRRLLLCLFLITACVLRAQPFVPDGRIRPDDHTVFMAVDAKLSAGLTPFQPGGHGKFHVQGWQRADQQAAWIVEAPAADACEVRVVLRRRHGPALHVIVGTGGKALESVLTSDAPPGWDRLELQGLLALPAGRSTLTLRLAPEDGASTFEAEVHAVELVRPSVRAALAGRAIAMRSDPSWFQKARYGIMVHWTSQSVPLRGAPVSYQDAVAAFDVEAFAAAMQRAGAGFVVFTTAHAMQFFPAPLASLDRLLPGRTSRRDLVADLADALGRRGLKLMLYHHPGTAGDAEWVRAAGLFDADPSQFFAAWQEIITEAGRRYGDRLAGWWFDDGSVGLYYRSPPWEALARAAKAGHPGRLISFNAWELANPTLFHDFCTGEGCQEPRGIGGLLTPGGDGRYPRGTHAGLQASACLIAEKDWGHFVPDTPLPPPSWTPDRLAALLKGFIACRNVPILNLQITQDGRLSEATLAVFERARAQLD